MIFVEHFGCSIFHIYIDFFYYKFSYFILILHLIQGFDFQMNCEFSFLNEGL